jgi:glycine C-acetyltransferase
VEGGAGRIAPAFGTEEVVLFPSGYHANTGLFEALLGDHDYVFCDEMVRPSLADGIRLCRARVFTYRHQDLSHLEDRLRRSKAARFRVIATDGVFPLDGAPAALEAIYGLAQKYDALVAVDDSHGLGVWGENGRGTHAHLAVAAKADLVTASFGNALGGGAGGLVACRAELAAWLRQKSRPYLASTALSPPCTAAALKAAQLIQSEGKLREGLRENVRLFREALHAQGLTVATSEHPAVAVVVGHAVAAQRMADLLYRRGIYALGFCHPVVPEGAARIRAQVTAKHTARQLREAAETFAKVARELGLQLHTVTANPVA